MFKKVKIIISHPVGNSNVRQLLDGFINCDFLDTFYTSISVFKGNVYDNLTKFKIFKEFERRRFNDQLRYKTISFPIIELCRILALKTNIKKLTRHETGIFSIDKVCRFIDKKVSENIVDNKYANMVYAYEDVALRTFENAKKKGVICLYDLPIGYWRAAYQLLDTERIKRPEWACTMVGFQNSENKLNRKDEEIALADYIFVASSFTLKTLELYTSKLPPVFVIPYGFPPVINNRLYLEPRNRKLKLLFVGGLTQRKGIANVFEAVESLFDDVELTVVGRKPTENCEPLNKALLKHVWIKSLSHQEILTLMREADILLFPSLFEGFGLVITESMSQGTPVITTTRTCGADFIKDGENGWLVEPGNTSDLVEKLTMIINKPWLIKIVGLNCLETAKKRPQHLYGMEVTNKIQEIQNLNVVKYNNGKG